MSVTLPEAAVEAAWKERWDGTNTSKKELRRMLEAALPHLRRDWLEGLIAKLASEPGPGWTGYKAWTGDWLRAELEGDDRG